MKALAIALTLTLLCASAQAEDESVCVFGYCMGQTIDGEPKGTAKNGLHYIKMQQHPLAFDEGWVYYTQETGVCAVRGYFFIDNADNYGDAHKVAFNRFVDLISEKYGQPTEEFDFLETGSIWNKPRDWLTALRKKERHLLFAWTENLPHGIEGIFVIALPAEIKVEYNFSNYKECRAIGQRALGADF